MRDTEAGEAASEAPPPSAAFPWYERAAILAAAIYYLGPWRNLASDLSAFLLGLLGLVLCRHLLPARPQPGPSARTSLAIVAAVTILGVAGLIALGMARGIQTFRLPLLALTCILYLPFAYLQQLLAQRYLVGRLGGAFGKGDPRRAALLGGLLFGFAHLPFPDLVLPTLCMGVLWGWAYVNSGRLLPLALSHALLGTTWFLAVLGRDPFRDLGLGV